MIKRKYENLAYEQHLVEKFSEDSHIRRPYEECYIKMGLFSLLPSKIFLYLFFFKVFIVFL